MIYSLQTARDVQNALGFHSMYSSSPARALPFPMNTVPHLPTLSKENTQTTQNDPDITTQNDPDVTTQNDQDVISLTQPESNLTSKSLTALFLGNKDSASILKTLERQMLSGLTHKSHQLDLEIGLVENHPLCLLRSLIGLEILRDRDFSVRDKVDAYTDFFSNLYVTQKTKDCLQKVCTQLEWFLDGDRRADDLDLGKVYEVNGLKFKQKDDLVELLKLWLKVMKDTKTNRVEWDLSRHYLFSEKEAIILRF